MESFERELQVLGSDLGEQLKLRTFCRLVFWQNMASHHQAWVLMNLAAREGFEVIWVVNEGLGSDRAAMGWPEFEGEGLRLVVNPSPDEIEKLICDGIDSTIHAVGGVIRNKTARYALQFGAKNGANFVLTNEAPIPNDVERNYSTPLGRLKDIAVPFIQSGIRRRFSGPVHAAFCYGGLAEEAYKQFGWGEKVIPFGYFPPGPESDFRIAVPEGRFKILYLGQFTHRKGVDVLVEALGGMRTEGWEAQFFGEGVLKGDCVELARTAGTRGSVNFSGYLGWEAAMEQVAQSDLLVVPSRHDGWGAVVGESIMRGVPVVTTDRTGSAVLLKDNWRGGVVKAGDSSALAAEIDRWVAQGRLNLEDRKRIYEWGKRLEPENAARYFAEVIRWIEGGDRPVAPWLCD